MSFTNLVKTVFNKYFLKKEDDFYLLQEDGGKIILEDSGGWNTVQSHSSTLTNLTKN